MGDRKRSSRETCLRLSSGVCGCLRVFASEFTETRKLPVLVSAAGTLTHTPRPTRHLHAR